MKKWPEVLQANRSGVPSKLLFSSLIHEILGKNFLIFLYNLRSGAMRFLGLQRRSLIVLLKFIWQDKTRGLLSFKN